MKETEENKMATKVKVTCYACGEVEEYTKGELVKKGWIGVEDYPMCPTCYIKAIRGFQIVAMRLGKGEECKRDMGERGLNTYLVEQGESPDMPELG